MIRQALRFSLGLILSAVFAISLAHPAAAQRNGGAATPLPSIEEHTSGMERMDGLLPLYWDADQGQLWMEIPRLGEEMILRREVLICRRRRQARARRDLPDAHGVVAPFDREIAGSREEPATRRRLGRRERARDDLKRRGLARPRH